MKVKASFFFILLAWTGVAQARVFSFTDSNVAAYFRTTGGLSKMHQDAFGGASGDQTFFPEKDDPFYNYSAEIGVKFSLGNNGAVRIGVEGLQTRQIEAPGYLTNGDLAMTVNSKVSAFIPNLTFEIDLKRTALTKTYMFFGGGYAMVKGSTDTKMTTDGSAAYGGVGDYKEAVEGTAILYQAGAGFEFSFVDNATLSTELGWRQLNVEEMTYSTTVTTANGPQNSGATVTNHDGTQRKYNLGGAFIGIALRFYLPPFR